MCEKERSSDDLSCCVSLYGDTCWLHDDLARRRPRHSVLWSRRKEQVSTVSYIRDMDTHIPYLQRSALLVARPLSPRSGGAEQTAVQAHRRLVLCAACRLACYVCNGWSEAVGTGMRQLARVWDIGMHDNSPGRTETMPKSGGIELIEIGELVCIRLKKTNVLTLQRLREVRERTECRSVN